MGAPRRASSQNRCEASLIVSFTKEIEEIWEPTWKWRSCRHGNIPLWKRKKEIVTKNPNFVLEWIFCEPFEESQQQTGFLEQLSQILHHLRKFYPSARCVLCSVLPSIQWLDRCSTFCSLLAEDGALPTEQNNSNSWPKDIRIKEKGLPAQSQRWS